MRVFWAAGAAAIAACLLVSTTTLAQYPGPVGYGYGTGYPYGMAYPYSYTYPYAYGGIAPYSYPYGYGAMAPYGPVPEQLAPYPPPAYGPPYGYPYSPYGPGPYGVAPYALGTAPGIPPIVNPPGLMPPGTSLGMPDPSAGAPVGPAGVASAIGVPSAPQPSPPAAASVTTDTIRFVARGDNSWAFDPTPVRIPVGQTITWVNNSDVIIQIVSEDNSTFDSGALAPGESFSFTPTLIGTVYYRDKLHPNVRGVLVAVGQ
jgi:plastocyanin